MRPTPLGNRFADCEVLSPELSPGSQCEQSSLERLPNSRVGLALGPTLFDHKPLDLVRPPSAPFDHALQNALVHRTQPTLEINVSWCDVCSVCHGNRLATSPKSDIRGSHAPSDATMRLPGMNKDARRPRMFRLCDGCHAEGLQSRRSHESAELVGVFPARRGLYAASDVHARRAHGCHRCSYVLRRQAAGQQHRHRGRLNQLSRG